MDRPAVRYGEEASFLLHLRHPTVHDPHVEALRLIQSPPDDLHSGNEPVGQDVLDGVRVARPAASTVDQQNIAVKAAEVNGRLQSPRPRADDDTVEDMVFRNR